MPLETVVHLAVRGFVVKESRVGEAQHLTIESDGSTEAFGATVAGGRFRVADSVFLSGISREEVGKARGKPYYHAGGGWTYFETFESNVRKELPATVMLAASALMSRLEAFETGTLESSRIEMSITEKMARELADAINEVVPEDVPIESVSHPLI